MKIGIGFLIGAIVALLLARFFWFDIYEVTFTRMIFEIGMPPFDFLVETETFKKSIISLIVGGFTGSALAFKSKKRTKHNRVAKIQ